MKNSITKILLLLSFFSLSSSADIIKNVSMLDKKNKCIYNDYYNSGGKFYYHYVSNDKTYSTSSKNYTNTIVTGYEYDTESNKCYPAPWLILGMNVTDFNFLMALIGVLFGFVFMASTIYLFLNVGREK